MFTPQVVLSVYYSLLGGMALSHFSKKENKPYRPGVSYVGFPYPFGLK